MVPEEGVEPTHSCEYGILSPARLPVPPLRPELFRISHSPPDYDAAAAFSGVRNRKNMPAATSCAITPKATTASIDQPYSTPINALPANHDTP